MNKIEALSLEDQKSLKRFIDHFEYSLEQWNPQNGPLVTITRTQAVNLLGLAKQLYQLKKDVDID